MKKNYLKFLLGNHQLGFTILELLVTMVIAGSAISILLFLMVEGMTYNQREQALNQVNNDLKLALNYISEDVREAVYVYNGEQLESRINGTLGGVNSFLPSFGANTRPILAFWKVEPLNVSLLPNDCQTAFASNTAKKDECETVKIERRAYTLVVYLQSTDNSTGKWKGESRIEKYELNKYSNLTTLERTSGYVDPVRESSFQRWPVSAGGVNLQVGTPPNNTAPLVDFIASPTALPNSIPNENCPSNTQYKRSPNNNDTKSFFACVRNADDDETFNQDVILYLRGSAKGKQEVQEIKNYEFSFLKTQVLSRGVLTKTVSD